MFFGSKKAAAPAAPSRDDVLLQARKEREKVPVRCGWAAAPLRGAVLRDAAVARVAGS
jgi:hypothetical protein